MKIGRVIAIGVLLALVLLPVSLAGATGDPPPGGDPGIITVLKFHDLNRNGVQDAGEAGVANWLIRLYRFDSTGLYKVREGLTGPDGTVTFTDLVPTRYKVWEVDDVCWEPTTPNLSSYTWDGGHYALFTLLPGQSATVVLGNVYTCEPQGGEGCTPGYWKQSQHFDSWVGYTPTQGFADYDVFNTGPGVSLLDALKAKGGGQNALMRHATAALLNAANPDVSYLYSVAEVISMVQGAFISGDFEAAKNLFEAQNELLCPLN